MKRSSGDRKIYKVPVGGVGGTAARAAGLHPVSFRPRKLSPPAFPGVLPSERGRETGNAAGHYSCARVV